MNLDLRVETLAGVGVTVATKLERIGVRTVGDLLTHYPRRYDDFSNVIPIRAMKPGNVTFRGEIVTIASRHLRGRRLQITEAVLTDGTGTVKAVWFNQPYLVRQYKSGSKVLLAGKLEFRAQDLALQNPAIENDSEQTRHTARIVPIYRETEGLTSKQLRNLIMPLLPRVADLPETLPDDVITREKLLARSQALKEIHAPSSEAHLRRARRRLAFEELFTIIAASLVIKREIKTETAPRIKLNVDVAQAFTKALDFNLTNAQRAAAWQILQDISFEQTVHWLLTRHVL